LTEWITRRWRSSITRQRRAKKKKQKKKKTEKEKRAAPIKASERERGVQGTGSLPGPGQRPGGRSRAEPSRARRSRASKTRPEKKKAQANSDAARRAKRACHAAAQEPLAANCADDREAVPKEYSTRTRGKTHLKYFLPRVGRMQTRVFNSFR